MTKVAIAELQLRFAYVPQKYSELKMTMLATREINQHALISQTLRYKLCHETKM